MTHRRTPSQASSADWQRPPQAGPVLQLRRSGRCWTADPSTAGTRVEDTKLQAGPHLLIDLPNWLGDLVMALPATDRMVRANSGGSTTLLVRPATARLAQTLFPRTRVIATPRQQMPFVTVRELLKRGSRADIGVTLRNASRAKIVLRLVSRWRLGTASQGGRLLLNRSHTVVGDRHQVHDADPLLAGLGLPGADPAWRTDLPGDLRAAGSHALDRARLDRGRPAIGLAPGVACGGSAKRWPEENFARLAASLQAQGFAAIVVVGPGEGALAETVVAASGQDTPVVGEDLDAAGLAGVLCSLDGLVGNDSGPAHLAGVLGVPAVALFGPTDARRTAPLGSTTAAVGLDLPCSPCMRLQCPLGHRDCMRRLSVEDVESRLLALVGQSGGVVRRAVQA